jgi:hypothetical protein
MIDTNYQITIKVLQYLGFVGLLSAAASDVRRSGKENKL